MSLRDYLRVLKVCHSWNEHLLVFHGLAYQLFLQLRHHRVDRFGVLTAVQSRALAHQVVSRTRRMQLIRQTADTSLKQRVKSGVHVFGVLVEFETALAIQRL